MSEKPTASSTARRHRSPVFTKAETELLLKLVEKYKLIIMNKSLRATALRKRDEAWLRITRQFNRESKEGDRSAKSLIIKFTGLKKEAKRICNNILDSDVDCSISNSTLDQVTSMITETQGYNDDNPTISDNDDQSCGEEKKHSLWIDIDKKGEETSGEEDNGTGKRNRSANFSTTESSLLLKCVREEKDVIFSDDKSGKSFKLKNRAWERITAKFNTRSPCKRSTVTLRTRFATMQKLMRKIGSKEYIRSIKHKKHEKLVEDTENIKKEPHFTSESEDDWPKDDETDFHNSVKDDREKYNFAPDPLSSVLNGDSGMGSSHTDSLNLDNPEIMKLKLELLNYQMDTAKMERKRIEDLIEEDAKSRESRAIETAIRLRAARLQAIAAEANLPPSHPALRYPAEETPAMNYLNQYSQSEIV